MEEKQNKSKTSTKLIIIGIMLILIGAAMIVYGALTSDKYNPSAFIFIGVAVAFFSILFFGYGLSPFFTKVGAQLQNESLEKAGSDLEKVATKQAEITKKGVRTTAKAVKEGFAGEDFEEHDITQTKYCSKCGQRIDRNSKFCKHCGTEQK